MLHGFSFELCAAIAQRCPPNRTVHLRRRRPRRARRRTGLGRPARRRFTGSTSRAGRSSGSMTAASSSEWPTPFRVGSLAPRASGGFIAGTDRGIAEIDLDSEQFEIVDQPRSGPARQSLQRRQGRSLRAASGRAPWTIPSAGDSGHALSPRAGPGARPRSTGTIGSPTAPRSARPATVMYHNDSAPAGHLCLRSRRRRQRHQPPRLSPIRRGRRLSRRNDRRCRRLPVDRLLGRLVRPPLFPGRRVLAKRSKCRSSDRPAAHSAGRISTGSTSPRPASDLDEAARDDATKCRGVVYGHTGRTGASGRSLCGLTRSSTTNGD